jgi:hypothetical protein
MKELSNCLVDGVITNYEIDQAVENNFLRPDIYLELEKFKKK